MEQSNVDKSMVLIDKNAALDDIRTQISGKDHRWLQDICESNGLKTACTIINIQPEVDAAKILQLVDEIEDTVNEIAACSESIDRSTRKLIVDKLREIGKELTHNAGTD